MDTQRTGMTQAVADWFGIAASTACAIHCLLIPALLVTGTILPASFLTDEAFHQLMLLVILPAAILAFGIGCWRHKDQWVLVLGMIGVTGMVLAVTVVHDLVGESGERIVTVLSAAVLVAAHLRNFRICRSMDCDHNHA
ncbi:MAG: MerC domain-containing protein [Woeseiaceae bacterium]|nr:MerC domain-containing protein [Woeseiaceae bacterium]